MLSFQRLDVYQRTIVFVSLIYEVTDRMGRGHAERADQLVRAAESVIRNISEAAGRMSKPDAARHYAIARGEAMECAGSLDILRLRGLVDDKVYAQALSHLEAIVSMLTKLA